MKSFSSVTQNETEFSTSTTSEVVTVMTIRKANAAESIQRTGRAKLYYCLITQLRYKPGILMETRYMPVLDPNLIFAIRGPVPVVFHELFSETGERFAHPQIVCKDEINPGNWQEAELEAFSDPIEHWGFFAHDKHREKFQFVIEPCVEYLDDEALPKYAEFYEALDNALAPYVIHSMEDFRSRFPTKFADLANQSSNMPWSNVG